MSTSVSSLVASIKSRWCRRVLRTDGHPFAASTFERLYWVPDPYVLTSARERVRQETIAEIVRTKVGPVESLLDIGCGEGRLTELFVPHVKCVVAIEPSARAVRRARRRVPGIRIECTDLESFANREPGVFDVVTACEMIYYLPDIERAIAYLSSLGRTCVVSYFRMEIPRLDPILERLSGVQFETIEVERSRWRVAWWPGSVPRRSGRS